MRFRLALAVSLVVSLAGAAVPAASGALRKGMGVTVNAIPDPSVTGDPVVIYGRTTAARAGRPVHLYTLILPRGRFVTRPHYTLLSAQNLSASGFYEFVVPGGTVVSNRHWLVIASKLLRSRGVLQQVVPSLSVTPSTVTTATGEPVTLSGSLSPAHAHEAIFLESQAGTGIGWRLLARRSLDRHSRYRFKHNFTFPGTYALRVYFHRDGQNTSQLSDLVTVVVQGSPAPGFSASTATPLVNPNQSATITGTLDAAGSTTVPQPATAVYLYGHVHGSKYQKLAQATTDLAGNYSFTLKPTETETYQVRVAAGAPRKSGQVVIGVRQLVSIKASRRTVSVGKQVIFRGQVSPRAGGHLVLLQRLVNHVWVKVAVSHVKAMSRYSVRWTIGAPGKEVFRVAVAGGPLVASADSPNVTVKSTLPAVQSLPTAPL